MKLTDRTLAGRPADLAAENRELHQLRAQVAALLHACGELEQELDENVGVMNALRRQRDEAEAAYRAMRDDVNRTLDQLTELGCPPLEAEGASLALRRYLAGVSA